MQDRLTNIRWRRTNADPMRLRAVGEALASPGLGSESLKREGRSSVRRLTVASLGECTVKVAPDRGWLARVRARLGLARADRHWEGASWLAGAGVRTPRPLALGSARDADGPVSVLVLEYLAGTTALGLLADPGMDARSLRRVGEALGELVAAMTVAGRFNRDHKPSNLLLTRVDPPEAAVLDCVGLRPVSRRDVWRGADRMLASMIIEPLGCGLRVPPALRLAVVRGYLARVWKGEGPEQEGPAHELHGVDRRSWMRASRRRLWARVEALVERHGPMAPAVNPLGT